MIGLQKFFVIWFCILAKLNKRCNYSKNITIIFYLNGRFQHNFGVLKQMTTKMQNANITGKFYHGR